MQEVTRGARCPLDAVYRNAANDLVDPPDPLVDILDANSVVVDNAVPVRESLGHWNYPGGGYLVGAGATLGVWTARWTGTVDGDLLTAIDEFEVVAALTPTPVPPASGDASSWRPTVAEIAALLAQRPGDSAGVAQTSFDADTVPTATQVAVVIGQVQGEVIAETGDMPAELATVPVAGDPASASPAGNVVALGAAARVERQFFPDLASFGTSLASQWHDDYVRALAALVKAVEDIRSGGEVGTDEDDVLMPTWAFPAAVETGRGTSTWEGF